jgi:hypothetical protein
MDALGLQKRRATRRIRRSTVPTARVLADAYDIAPALAAGICSARVDSARVLWRARVGSALALPAAATRARPERERAAPVRSDTQPRATVVATALHHPRGRRRPSQTKQRAAPLPPRRSMAASANASACASGGGDRVAPCGSAVSQTALRRRRECAWDAARAGQVWIRIRVLRSGGRDVIARSAPMSTRVGL